jgi:outer membrane protein OmpA-like peptidoglycan-associated protein
MRFALTVFISFFLMSNVFSQSYSTENKRAIKFFQAATQAYQYTEYDKSLDYVNEAINKDENFIEAYLFKAQVLNVLERTMDEADTYKKAIMVNDAFFKYTYLNSAKAHFRAGQYDIAKQHALSFMDVAELKKSDIESAKRIVQQIVFAKKSMANPVEIDPHPLNDYINGAGDVYWPSMTVDNSVFYFTAKLPASVAGFQEDIYRSVVRNDSFGRPFRLNNELLSPANEGASFISPDGRFLLYTGCRMRDGFGSCDLYISRKNGDKWERGVNMGGKVNSNAWDSRPVISSDGNTLYFSSNRKGGKGRSDIYLCRKTGETDDGYPEWGKPINLGDSVNTKGDEFAPFIHADNKTLYFSSDYHLGLGGQDIFMVKKKGPNDWSTPQNLGYPINKNTDEIGLFIDAPGDFAYYATDDSDTKRSIYRFAVPEAIKPDYVTYVKLFVRDKETFRPLSAVVNLFDIQSGETITDIKAEGSDGSALVSLPSNARYGLMIEKKGYLFYSDHFDLVQKNENFVKELTIDLQPIKTGQSVVLNNVFFKFNSFELSDESIAELIRLQRFLEQNSQLHVEISGHTDNKGDDAYNQELSQQRAKAVYDYLITKGIEVSRLSYKGYGMRKPIAENTTIEGRAKNRRTEMTVTKLN